MGIVIKNVLAVLPEGEHDVIKQTSIYVEGDRITGIGEVPDGFLEERVIDGRDRLVIPGLINCHTHSYMSPFRNVADDLSFQEWLFETVMPLEEQLTGEDAHLGANLAILEMMKSGTTCFQDMQMHIHQTTKAVRESGMRAVIGRGLVGSGNDEAGSSRLQQAYEEMEAFQNCSRLTFCLAPHAPYTCDEAFLNIVAEQAKEKGLGVHIHLSESRFEVEEAKKNWGVSPIALCERAHIFDVPTVAAHCVHVDEADLEILAAKNVSVVTNPASNMKLGNGFAPIPSMMEKGINICIGTDGAASNNALNLFHELSLLTLIHKGNGETAQCISAKEAFRIATVQGARALSLDKEIGSIEVGKKADLAILNLNTPSMTPRNNLLAGLSYSANGSEVETVIIDGRITMEKGHVLTMDEEKIYFGISKLCERLGLDRKEY